MVLSSFSIQKLFICLFNISDIITNNGVTGICVEISIKDKNGNDCYLVSTGDEKLLYFDKESTLKTEKHIDIKKLL